MPSSTTSPRPPLWIMALVLLCLASSAWDFFTGLQRTGGVDADFALSVLQLALLAASAIGLWRMRKWGAIAFLAAILIGALIRLPMAIMQTPAYLAHWPFCCTMSLTLAFYAAILIGLFRLWRLGTLQ